MTSEWGEDDKRVGRGRRVCRDQMCDVAGWELRVGKQGKTRVRAREKPMVRWQRGEGVGHGTSLPGTAWTWHCDTWGEHGDNCEVQCGPAVRKKPRFTHGRDNLRGDVSGKRFNTHAVERNGST